MMGKRHGAVWAFVSVLLAIVLVADMVPSEALSMVVDTYGLGKTSSTVTDVSEVAPQGGSEGQKKSEVDGDIALTPSVVENNAGGTEVGSEEKKPEPKVVYARFEPGFDGVERIADIDVTLDGGVWSLPKCVYAREGYEFTGWSTTMDGHDVVDDVATVDVDESRKAVAVADGQEMVDFRFRANETDAEGNAHEVERDLSGYVEGDVLTLWAQWKYVEVPKGDIKEEEGLKEEAPEDMAAKAADDKVEDASKNETAKSVKDEEPKEANNDTAKDAGEDVAVKSGEDADGVVDEKANGEALAETEDKTGKTGDASKRYTHRLIVGMSPTMTITVGTVLGRLDGAVLLGFEDEGSLEKAEAQYKLTAEYVARDVALGASAGEDVKDVEMSVKDNPFAVAEEAANPLSAPMVTQDVLVGLLDTGAPADNHVIESMSVMGDGVTDVNGHAKLMLDTMVKENENVRVMSVKVLDDEGHGTASSVYAGVMYAVDNGVKVINMSFAGPDTEGNAAIAEAVRYALDHDVVVIAAAGNGGYDASLVTPANVEGVFTVGAADENGKMLVSSNRGTCVDVFVEASSTSVAAAYVSGQVSLGLDGWRERVGKLGIDDGEAEAPIETMPVGDGVRASASRTITFDAGEGTFDGGGKTNQIAYVESGPVTKYAHTSNISDAGVRNGYYPNYQRDKQVVQIPGATSLHVSLAYGTEGYRDQVFVIKGEYTGTVSQNMNVTGQIGMYQGGYYTPNTVEFDVDGDTVTFAFYSDSAASYYGYYAVVTGMSIEVTGSYKEPIAPTGACFWYWVNASGQVVNWQDCTTTQTLTAVYGSTKAHFMSNGGTGTMADLSLVPGVTAPYGTFVGPSDKPYFAYWTTEADGSGARYDVGDELPYEADLTLYAQYVSLEEATAYAVLESDGTLTFFRAGVSYANGSTGTFSDVNGVSRSGTLYTGFETMSYSNYLGVPWYNQRTNIRSVRFAQGIKPTSTAYWFYGCSNLANFDSTNLDTSSVTNMNSMFSGCSGAAFNPDVSSWNTSKVTDMSYMFQRCSGAAFNPDVSNWNTSSVTGMYGMFYNCSGAALNPDVSKWDTSKVTGMGEMFYNCWGDSFNPDVSKWNTSSVTDMEEMFYGCSGAAFNPDVSKWNTSKVTHMGSMFRGCYGAAFNPDVSNWNTSSVTGMYGMFRSCYGAAFNPDVSAWDTSKVTDLSYMFSGCSGAAFNPDVSAWDTSSVTNMGSMFAYCSGGAFNPDVSAWDTSSVTNMGSMFSNCSGVAFTSIDLSGWDIGRVQTVSYMFNNCSKLETIYAHQSADWNALTQMTASNSMFTGCSLLVGGAGTAYDSGKLDKAYARVDGLGGTPGYFTARGTAPINHYAILESNGTLTFFDVAGDVATGTGKTVTDVDGVTRTGELFHVGNGSYLNYSYVPWYNRRESIKSVRFAQETSPLSTAYWFYGCRFLGDFDSTNLDTSSVTSMCSMFDSCYSNSFNPNVSNWDTSKVTNMGDMFMGCSGAAFNPDVSKWNTSSVTNMYGMFWSCSGARFNPDVSDWNTSSVTTMGRMFSWCSGASFTAPDMSAWDTSSVMDMSGMFDSCSGAAFTSIDLSGLDFSKIISEGRYLGLQNCTNLKQLKVSAGARIAGVPEHTAQGKYLSTWENKSLGITNMISADMVTLVNDGQGAGTWEWEKAPGIPLKKVDSVTSSGLSGATFELRDMAGNVIDTGITTENDGTFELCVDDYGEYLLVETSAPEGHSISANGWLVSVTDQGVTVRANGTKTANGITTQNESSKPTITLADADKADAYQKNYQRVTQNGFTVTKQSEWTDIVQGRMRTTITVQTPELPPAQPAQKKDRVVYAFTTCIAHDFSGELARRNVELLLANYEHVDLIIADGPSVSNLRILCDVTSTEVLDPIVFDCNQHWAVNLFTGLDEYLKTHDPSVVYVSHDRLVAGDGANWDRSMEGTWGKLKAYQAQGRYFEVRGGYRLDESTTTDLGWKTIAGFIDPSSWNGYDNPLDMSIVTDVETNVDKPFDVLGFEYEDPFVSKVASTRLNDVVMPGIGVRDFTVTGDAVVTLDARSLSMDLTWVEPGSTVTVTIDGMALNTPTGSWFDTNYGELTLSDIRKVNGTRTETNINVPSPKLSKPSYTYTGELLAKDGDTWLVPDNPIRTHDLTILKTDGTDPLANATFTLTGTSDDGHAVSQTVTSGANGIVAFGSIREGTYTLTETKAPTGYTAMIGEAIVTITADGISIPGVQKNGSGQFVIPNHRNTSQLTLRKVDATTRAVLPGAKFTVIGRNEAGDLIDLEVTTGEDGTASIDLMPGTLWVTETVAPTGYVLDPSAHQLKVVSGTEVYWDGTRLDGTVVDIENVEASSTLTIVKQWVDGGGDRPAPNIDVSGSNGFFLRTSESTVWEKSGNTWTLTIGVPAGLTFSVWEDGCPGYVSSNPDGNPLIVSSGGTATITNTIKSQAPVTHKVTLLKTASDTHMGLGGATFRLRDTVTGDYAVVDGSGVVVSWVGQAQASTFMSSGNGYLEVRGLSAGSYAFEEVEAPEGYNVAADAAFELAADGTLLGSGVVDGVVAMTDTPVPNAVTMPGTGGVGVDVAGAVAGLALVLVPCAEIARRRHFAKK